MSSENSEKIEMPNVGDEVKVFFPFYFKAPVGAVASPDTIAVEVNGRHYICEPDDDDGTWKARD